MDWLLSSTTGVVLLLLLFPALVGLVIKLLQKHEQKVEPRNSYECWIRKRKMRVEVVEMMCDPESMSEFTATVWRVDENNKSHIERYESWLGAQWRQGLDLVDPETNDLLKTEFERWVNKTK